MRPKKPRLRLIQMAEAAAHDEPSEHGFAPGPWSDNAAYHHQLLAECIALRAGDDITPNAHHVACIVDLLMTLSDKTDRLTHLAEDVLERFCGRRVAQRMVRRTLKPEGLP